ncbi:phage tail sheath subtilisin-like domain-containing protein [Novosphingobium sp. P6W]|uniref:phage tail sheath subtilisin-like domain-containing protein n=1 Tax=Novosphingobium sp. P6W TaxID=1609758 RepID=UPI0005C2D95C|nr:phage tail sheath subtilisin-like domain-containing protein [Novosphingobium sp. P6W]AXB75463.1 phage tail protein [Novosphingobium sp. P6W]KIS32510.1 tail sheath protein [Novosphingobium sp. P6W]
MAFKHGITITEITEGARTLTAISTSIIGLVATGADASADVFPLDRPALITDIETAIGSAGVTGTLANALRAIADQTRPILVVVRVEEGATPAETASNVIGTTDANGQKTGMQALLAAQAQLGVKPKILGTPGLETQAVTAALVVVAQKLRAFAYARAIGETVAAATAYRANFTARELMLLMPDFLAWNTDASATVTSYAAARAMGLRALIDTQTGPQKTLSNVAVSGVVGLTKDIHWDIEDQTSEAAVLNAAQVTALVRTVTGNCFWGNRTTAEPESPFVFESTTRVAQLLADTIVNGMLWAMDKPLTPSLAKDIIETINGLFRQLKAGGVILGANAWFDEANNDVSALKAGKLRIDYDYAVPPPLEDLGFNQRITDSYFADFSAQLTADV